MALWSSSVRSKRPECGDDQWEMFNDSTKVRRISSSGSMFPLQDAKGRVRPRATAVFKRAWGFNMLLLRLDAAKRTYSTACLVNG
uniref:Uncharacterized protein n=1 Tax=Steinernema glaseri TaxID=37863 RepID=A0A1I7XWZ2_9BILA